MHPRARHSASASTSSSRSHTSRSSSTTADSRCIRTSSGWSSHSGRRMTSGITLHELAHKEVAELESVSAKLEARLEQMELRSVLDVLQHYPRRWVDRTKRAEIAALTVGEEATVVAEVRTIRGRRARTGKPVVDAVVHDGTSLLNVVFFNQGWREKQLPEGTEVALFGKLDVYRGKRQMTNPVVDVLGRAGVADEKTGVIVPVYPQSGKAEVYTWQLRKIIGEALRRCAARGFAEPLDEVILDEHDLVGRGDSYRAIHLPETMEEQRAARRRLVFDE